ncbi:MAG TPA: DUF2892 domain-containing protein [Thermoanaerobaculia bacterium]|jgi:hypothetical protein
MEKNVATIERWASLIGGGVLLAYALRRKPRVSPLSGALALGWASLLFRGATGHCPIYGALGVNTADLTEDWARPLSHPRHADRTFRGKWPLPEGARLVQPGQEDELVEDASRHSFPASDPPSFTPTRVG